MTPTPDQDNDQEPDRQSRQLFTGWLLGPKRFIIVVIGFFLILFAETWWTWQELAAKAQCEALTQDFLCWAPLFPQALVQGFVTAGFCLISLWFINYAIPEVWKMISEMFKQQRYDLGHRRGLEQGIELGREQGHEQGLEQGLTQGRQEGRQEGILEGRRETAAQLKAWEDWNLRRETAQANGEPFTEPPPTLDRTANGHQ